MVPFAVRAIFQKANAFPAVLLLIVSLGGSAPASALSFTFSFTGLEPLATVEGTVTGLIVGLTDDATSPASAVYVTSSPAGIAFPLLPTDNVLAAPGVTEFDNSFTVANGVITATDFRVTFPVIGTGGISMLLRNFGGQNNLVHVINNVTFHTTTNDPATFALVPEAVPIPGALPLFATGLGALGFLAYRRKRRNAA